MIPAEILILICGLDEFAQHYYIGCFLRFTLANEVVKEHAHYYEHGHAIESHMRIKQ